MSQNTLALCAAAIAIIASIGTSGCVHAKAQRPTLQAFASEQELADLFRRWQDEHRRRQVEARRLERAPAAARSAPMSAPAAAENVAAAAADAITNVQHAGVDEGGIVKMHGDHLVILRRGRLFTVSVRDGGLQPVSTANAFAPDVEPRGAWYDEMLISGNTVIVIGYSYARGGTEVGLFEIDTAGRLRYRATYHLRSNDYYSSRNYASRLVGSKLIFYTPLRLNPWAADPYSSFPALRRWRPGATPTDFRRIAPATRIYRADEDLDPHRGLALHTVSICDLAKPELDCVSTAVLGSPGRVFYVSASSVFVWTTPQRREAAPAAREAAVLRIPLDGSAPSALKAAGSPIDQFSFLEGTDGFLNVMVRPNGTGDGMWNAERNNGQLALLRVPVSSFSDGRETAPRSAYRALPSPAGSALQQKFIGGHLVYGAGGGWHRSPPTLHSQAYAVRYAHDAPVEALTLQHGVDRIEALGDAAVVIGSDGANLHFTSVRLSRQAEIAGRHARANASQGETRSHGFYYRRQGNDEGLIGLPVIGGAQAASQQLRKASASLLFLRNQELQLSELGTLDSGADAGGANDGCVASCVDWYGNSRPLFVRNRIFALLGYEIVEGTIGRSGIVETRRITFAPHWVDAWR